MFILSMSSTKNPTAKKPSKHPHTSSDSFKNDDANMAFVDHYNQAPIILERIVDLEFLEGTFILDVFKERTWMKLLNQMGDVFEISFENSLPMLLWKMITLIVG